MPLHLRKRAGVWHYSRTVPHDVSLAVGARHWRFTLNTSSLREAEALRSLWDCKHQALIDRVRAVESGGYTHARRKLFAGAETSSSERALKIARPQPQQSTETSREKSAPANVCQSNLLVALDGWLAENKQKPSTVVKYRLHVRRLTEHIGNISPEGLTPEHIVDFVGAYSRLPNARSLSLRQRKLRMPELLALRVTDPALPPMGAVNVRKMIEYLRAFLRALGREELCIHAKKPKDDRPHAEQREGYSKFEPEQLRRILSAVDNEFGRESDVAWWVRVLTYSGMRPEEAAQLSRKNVHRAGSEWAIKIDDLDSRRVKNAQSLRTIPLHPALLRRGFLKFAHPNGNTTGQLFSSFNYDDKGGRSNNPSRRLKALLLKLGLEGRGSAHRFRASFIDALRNAQIPYSLELGLVGHADVNRVHGRYGDGVSLKTMAKAISSVDPLDS